MLYDLILRMRIIDKPNFKSVEGIYRFSQQLKSIFIELSFYVYTCLVLFFLLVPILHYGRESVSISVFVFVSICVCEIKDLRYLCTDQAQTWWNTQIAHLLSL